MKLKIEKKPHGLIRIELTYETSKRPVVYELRDGEAGTLINLLDSARRAEQFKFELELG